MPIGKYARETSAPLSLRQTQGFGLRMKGVDKFRIHGIGDLQRQADHDGVMEY